MDVRGATWDGGKPSAAARKAWNTWSVGEQPNKAVISKQNAPWNTEKLSTCPKKNSNSGCRLITYHNIGIIICFLGTGWKALETQLLTWPQKPCGSRLPNAGVEGVRKSSGLATKKIGCDCNPSKWCVSAEVNWSSNKMTSQPSQGTF